MIAKENDLGLSNINSTWEIQYIKDCPKQTNIYDCGVFVCTNAEHISRNAPLTFTEKDMPYLRNKMILDILEGYIS